MAGRGGGRNWELTSYKTVKKIIDSCKKKRPLQTSKLLSFSISLFLQNPGQAQRL